MLTFWFISLADCYLLLHVINQYYNKLGTSRIRTGVRGQIAKKWICPSIDAVQLTNHKRLQWPKRGQEKALHRHLWLYHFDGCFSIVSTVSQKKMPFICRNIRSRVQRGWDSQLLTHEFWGTCFDADPEEKERHSQRILLVYSFEIRTFGFCPSSKT